MALTAANVAGHNTAEDEAKGLRVESYLDELLIATWDGFSDVVVNTDDRNHKDADTVGLLRQAAVRRYILPRYTAAGWHVEIKKSTDGGLGPLPVASRVMMTFNRARG